MKTTIRKALSELQTALEEEVPEDIAESFIDKIEEEILELLAEESNGDSEESDSDFEED